MTDILHRVGIKATVAEVQAAVSTAKGIAGWLTANTTDASKPDSTVNAVFQTPEGKEMGKIGFEISKNNPQRVVWHFTSGPEQWVGTDVTFDLTQEGDYAIIIFGHRKWREPVPVEFFAHSSMKWAIFLMSLKRLIETGKGEASPYDVRVGNWS